jgi:acyl carrier protein
MDDLSARVFKILSGVLATEPSELTLSLRRENCPAWDSLRHMEIVVTLEDVFCIQLSYEEIGELQSVGDIVRVLTGKL